jgi:choline dehydrogenase-like flavoprotein
MIINLEEIDENKTYQADLCLIGSGPASLTILNYLKKTDLKIIIIPGGKFHFDKNNQKLYKGIVGKDNYHEPLIENRYREFGGTGNYWGGRCVPLDKIDFEKRSWIKNSGWPIRFNEIKKFYKEASNFLDISPYNEKTNFYKKDIKEIIEKMDGKFLSSKKLESWSPILSFKKKFLETIKKDNILLIDNSHLIKIDSNKKEITNLICKSLDKIFKVKCKTYVLACGGIENPRILLNSKNKFHPKGVGNANDLVGRFYMAHHSGIFLNIKPMKKGKFLYNYFKDNQNVYLRNRWWLNEKFQKLKKIGNSIFFLTYTLKSKDMGAEGKLFETLILFKKIISNKKDLFNWIIINQLIKVLFNFYVIKYLIKFSYLRFKKNRLPSILPTSLSKNFGLYHQVEQTPCYYSRLKLDKKKNTLGQNLIKLDLKFNSIDINTIWKSHEYLIKKIDKSKFGNIQKKYNKNILTKLYKQKLKKFNSMSHHMGTTRMSASSKKGVVDKNLKVHGINNLFIVGSSVFPTGGHANPTYTIVALSIRLSNFLKTRLKK